MDTLLPPCCNCSDGCCGFLNDDEIGIPLAELATELGDGDASPPFENLACPKIFSVDDEFDEGGLVSPYKGEVMLPLCSGCLVLFRLGRDNLPNKEAAMDEDDDKDGSWFL